MGEKEPTVTFYQSHLFDRVLPFWERAVDREYGGVYTCFDNSGDHVLSTDKYTWSQGRFLWMWSRIVDDVQRGIVPPPHRFRFYQDDCHRTASFLARNALMDTGDACFLLSRRGDKKRAYENTGLDASIYADCFPLLGVGPVCRYVWRSAVLHACIHHVQTDRRTNHAGVVLYHALPHSPRV